MNSTARDLDQISDAEASPVVGRRAPVGAAKRWVTGKVGEWFQGVDKEGAPIVYALAVDSSPFRTLTSVEPAGGLTVLINPDAPTDSAKVQKAIRELASCYGFAG